MKKIDLPIEVCLSIATDKLCCSMADVKKGVSALYGGTFGSITVRVLGDVYKPILLDQYPWMKEIDISTENVQSVVDDLKATHGETLACILPE